MSERLRIGWRFADGTELHIGHLPHRKSLCVYVVEKSKDGGAILCVLGFLRDDHAADTLAEYHAKLASGVKEREHTP